MNPIKPRVPQAGSIMGQKMLDFQSKNRPGLSFPVVKNQAQDRLTDL